jgi:hypothetical protein
MEYYSFKESITCNKSIITDDRSKIETLSYQCFGKLKKDIEKLVAQLSYPEHGYIDKYMSMRAIGIAYASWGIDPVFHHEFQFFLP